jgi:hypothetical protein
MSDQSQFLDAVNPLLDSDLPPVSINVTQSFGITNQLSLTGPNAVLIQVTGPQVELTQADISGVYPAPGSTNSPDDYLPHIALNRRTLPWERKGPNNQKPWLALLLVKDSELTAGSGITRTRRSIVRSGPALVSATVQAVQSRDPIGFANIVASMPATTQVNLVFLRNSILTAIQPQPADLQFLTNVKRTNSGNGDVDCSIIISNRLPNASGATPELHTAFLVSLEHRTDFYDATRKTNPNGEIGLIVLHSWSFTPSKGGDFEEVIRAIHIRPNGGVLRFGNLPESPAAGQSVPLSGGFDGLLDEHGLFLDPLPHTQAGLVNFRGPLRPFPPAPRSPGFAIRSAPEEFEDAPPGTALDYSTAVAFELGRLLALASQDVLEDLRAVHGIIKVIDPQVAINKLPVALQKPDWVVNPAWNDTPWSIPQSNDKNAALNPVLKDGSQFVGLTPGDVSGVNQQFQQIGAQVQNSLGAMQIANISQVTQLNIATVTTADLDKAFGNVAIKAQG